MEHRIVRYIQVLIGGQSLFHSVYVFSQKVPLVFDEFTNLNKGHNGRGYAEG